MVTFEKNISNHYGKQGKHWLADLPKLIKTIEAIYELSDLKPLNNLSYNYVLNGLQESQPIILKIGPDVQSLKQEAAALQAFAGYGIVKLLAEHEGLLLLERFLAGLGLWRMAVMKCILEN